MLIVYSSIAVIVLALFYLGIYAFRVYKASKPTIKQLTETTTRIQRKTEPIMLETNQLAEHQQDIINDINTKKIIIAQTLYEGRKIPKSLKSIWKIPAFNLKQKWTNQS